MNNSPDSPDWDWRAALREASPKSGRLRFRVSIETSLGQRKGIALVRSVDQLAALIENRFPGSTFTLEPFA